MNLPSLSNAEFKYSERGAQNKDEYVQELERFYELFVDYQNFTSKDLYLLQIKVQVLGEEIKKLRRELDERKLQDSKKRNK